VLEDMGGEFEAAARTFRRASRILSATRGEGHLHVAYARHGEALALLAMHRPEPARVAMERALAIVRGAFSEDNGTVATFLDDYGGILLQLGQVDTAIALHSRALATLERELGPDHPELSITLVRLADAQQERGDLADARRSVERAVAIDEATRDASHSSRANALHVLAEIELADNDPAGAIEATDPVVEPCRRPGADVAACNRVMLARAEAWCELGQRDRAKPLLATLDPEAYPPPPRCR
jgi:serine/threonine-protein kinase